ncbi:MAG: hypothetical protein VX589_06315 [Myxococcota bacterium]|nr:hypothetical protein [Myxococcota bacterium]
MLRFRCLIMALTVLCLAPSISAQDRGFSARTQRQLDKLKDEPSIQKAQQAALRFFNINPGAVQGMRNRAAFKGLMPQLEARYRHNMSDMDVNQINLNLGQNPYLFDNVEGTVREVQVGVRWDLPLLVFNSEVLDVGSLAILQEGVLKEVTRLYYTRRRLQIDLILNPPTNQATRLSKELRIDELTSTLDAMTDNLFSKAKARNERLERVNR